MSETPNRPRQIVTSTALLFGAATFSAAIKSASAVPVYRNIGVTLNAANLDSYALDVDQNGTTDFTIETAYVPDPVLTVGFDQIRSAFGSNNGLVIDTQTGDGFPPASLLLTGNAVSSTKLFSTSNDDVDLYYDDTIDPITGNFGGQTGYVGFRFDAADGTHYGFAGITVSSLNDTSPFNLTIGTVAYESTPATPIVVAVAPEPASLGILAIGSFGILARIHRRR